jgi:hypothetical protein
MEGLTHTILSSKINLLGGDAMGNKKETKIKNG